MTARVVSLATTKTIDLLKGENGMVTALSNIVQGDPAICQSLSEAAIRAQNVAPDLAEKSGPLRYPAVGVYCERLVNDLREKFRTFSGRAHMAIEIRHSHDRLEGLTTALETYADAVARTLDGTRGDWGDGMYYAGGYEVAFGGIKRGGRNFLQTATVKLALEISR
jgi:hypothetical protein